MNEKNNILIRVFEKKDLMSIEKIARQVWSIGGDYLLEKKYGIIESKSWQDWSSDSILGYINEKPDYCLVAEIQSLLVGFITWREDNDRKIGTIGYNAVNPQYGGKGIGSQLLNRVLNIFKENGLLYANVITGLNEGHTPARKMYEKAGFEPLLENIVYAMKLHKG
jgi:ribosomal protein S18 acetylase RimI-like enzyme